MKDRVCWSAQALSCNGAALKHLRVLGLYWQNKTKDGTLPLSISFPLEKDRVLIADMIFIAMIRPTGADKLKAAATPPSTLSEGLAKPSESVRFKKHCPKQCPIAAESLSYAIQSIVSRSARFQQHTSSVILKRTSVLFITTT